MSAGGLYPYASGDLLNARNVYSYSPYHGAPFLDAWAEARARARGATAEGRALSAAETPALDLIRETRANPEPRATLDKLVQRFEVTKRVHHAYGPHWRAVDKTAFDAMPAYVELAETCAEAWDTTGQLTYLNVLLKMLDTLSSLAGDLPGDLGPRFEALVAREGAAVAGLTARVAGATAPRMADLPAIPTGGAGGPSTVLLAAASARSRAYLEALIRFDMAPSGLILMGDDSAAAPLDGLEARTWRGLFLPDLRTPLADLAARHGIPVTRVPARNVNDPATRAAVAEVTADLVIYSGVGGQIVSGEVLAAGPPFLHMHAGWLPDYRGSTTFYYAMLNNTLPAVSAIYLDPGIDTGPIFARQAYPMPEGGMNVDLLYDPAIRADLLCRTLARFAAAPPEPELLQSPENGTTYYEIHPVLKHIALLSLSGELS